LGPPLEVERRQQGVTEGAGASIEGDRLADLECGHVLEVQAHDVMAIPGPTGQHLAIGWVDLALDVIGPRVRANSSLL
jgi:hypothetical protein